MNGSEYKCVDTSDLSRVYAGRDASRRAGVGRKALCVKLYKGYGMYVSVYEYCCTCACLRFGNSAGFKAKARCYGSEKG